MSHPEAVARLAWSTSACADDMANALILSGIAHPRMHPTTCLKLWSIIQ